MKLRSHLVALVVVAVLPVLIFALVMVAMHSNEQRQGLEARLLVDTARALSLAVDRELLASIKTLEGLATSEHLDSGDLRRFYDLVRRVLSARHDWENVTLLDPAGQQLVSLRQPLGSPLPGSGSPDLPWRVSATGKPDVSDLFISSARKKPMIAVDVPVLREGSVKYVLRASISLDALGQILSHQKIPPEWRAAI
ncbi:MAG TPA: cache domain-containing protein, partial [Planctomycetota bacterium]|nr:cache domain-containing protein [Planctomycetota bacterium]